VKGTIKNLDPIGHGIIQGDDGSKVPFLFIDAISRKILMLGQRVIFSVRRVQNNTFAENISCQSDRRTGARAG
jgi:cold shock CspA family protein